MNKCLALFLTIMHLIMTLVSFISAQSSSIVHNEGLLCKVMYPLNHLLYGVINFILMVAFLFILISTSVNDLRFLENIRGWGAFLVAICLYTVFLKHLTDASCEFWTVSWTQCLCHLIQFAFEGSFIVCFYDWYNKKVEYLKQTMRKSAQDLI